MATAQLRQQRMGLYKVLYGTRFDDGQFETAERIADVELTEKQKQACDQIIDLVIRAKTMLLGLADELPKMPLMTARIELDKAILALADSLREAGGLPVTSKVSVV